MHDRMRTASMAIVMVLGVGGCAGVPSGIPHAEQGSAQQRAEVELQDARAVATALRADLAGARIAAAKQEAELRELRRQVSELQQIVDTKQAELITLRNAQDRLTQSAAIAQVRVADPSELPARAADIHALEARLREMDSAITALTTELARIKQAMAQSPPAPLSPRSP